MIEYPKIETLYDRDEKTRRILPDQLRCPEFSNIRRWRITEKIDGTNIRVGLSPDGAVSIKGRTDAADTPVKLMECLGAIFTPENMKNAFDAAGEMEAVLFGEGYGAKIQKGGVYRKDMSFRLFDVRVGSWWLEPGSIDDIAAKLGIQTVPSLGEIESLPRTAEDLAALLGRDGHSTVAMQDGGSGGLAEGVVARTTPLLLTRRGDRVMWKLKFRDFK